MTSEPFGGFYSGRRVLVTGHTGFLGDWLTRWLVHMGAHVVGYSRSARPTAGWIAEPGDVTDAARLRAVFRRHRPDVVLHAAGQALVPAGFADPAGTMRANVLGSVNVLDAALRSGEARVVTLVGTPGAATVGPRDVADPYTASKCAAAAVAAAYAHPVTQQQAGRQAPLGVAVARPGVLLGGEWGAGRLLPTVVRAVAEQRPVVLQRPAARRPWQHVLDAASGILAASAHVGRQDAAMQVTYPLGRPDPGTAEPVRDVVALFLKHLGRPEWPVEVATEGAGDPVPPLDCATAGADLGWRPVWTLDDTLAAAAQWYRAAGAAPTGAPDVADQQIGNYLRDAAAAGLGWASRTPAEIGRAG
jgi:CDP-glucose 4,6-dehydratase